VKNKSQYGQVIWTCRYGQTCGGNGDRIRGIYGSFYHALRIGYDFKILWWDSPIDLKHVFIPRYFPWNETEAIPLDSKALAVVSFDNDNGLKECEWKHHSTVIVKTNQCPHSKCITEEAENLKLTEIFFGLQNDEKINDERLHDVPCIGCIFWFLFTLSSGLRDLLLGELTRFATWREKNKLADRTVIAIHLRMGDKSMNLDSGDIRHKENSLQMMIRCADRLSNKTSKAPPALFLATDSLEIKDGFSPDLKRRIFVSTSEPYHTDRGIKTENSLVTKVLSTWVDLLMLAVADGIVTSKSRFSALAVKIGKFILMTYVNTK
jgi:hypothetical protein